MTLKTFFLHLLLFSFFLLFLIFLRLKLGANKPFESRAIEEAGSFFSIEPPLLLSAFSLSSFSFFFFYYAGKRYRNSGYRHV